MTSFSCSYVLACICDYLADETPSFAAQQPLRWKWWTNESRIHRSGRDGLSDGGSPAKGAGHDVTVYNRNAPKAEHGSSEYGGNSAADAGRGRQGQEIVFCCVGRDATCAK